MQIDKPVGILGYTKTVRTSLAKETASTDKTHPMCTARPISLLALYSIDSSDLITPLWSVGLHKSQTQNQINSLLTPVINLKETVAS